jgi:hypothetical protein
MSSLDPDRTSITLERVMLSAEASPSASVVQAAVALVGLTLDEAGSVEPASSTGS